MENIPVGTLSFFVAALAAITIGMSKTGFPAIGILFVPLMAFAFETVQNPHIETDKMAVGAILPLLIFGDILAILYHRKNAMIKLILKLFPYLAVGLGLGWYISVHLNGKAFAPVLGALILGLIGIDTLSKLGFLKNLTEKFYLAPLVGILAGVTTTIGNAAGPVVSIYFLMMRLDKANFLGTAAWLFFIVNCSKIPIFLDQKMIVRETWWFALFMLPAVVVGGIIGKKIFLVVPQNLFNILILIISIISSVWLIIKNFI